MLVKMKIKYFSKRKLNVRISKTKIKCAILGFSQNCCILGKSRKKLVKLLVYKKCPIKSQFLNAQFWDFPPKIVEFWEISKKIGQHLAKCSKILANFAT